MMRAWIGIALLAGSWLFGLSYFDVAIPVVWIALVALGTLLLATATAGGAQDGDEKASESSPTAAKAESGHLGFAFPLPPSSLSLLAILLLLPVIGFATWPYRAAPLVLAVGLILLLLPIPWRWSKSLGAGVIAAGMVLLVQALVLTGYAALTSRSHDMPWPVAETFASLAGLLGIDAAADGPSLVMHSLRQPHRLAVTWDLVLDPATLCFLLGGLTLLGLQVWSRLSAARRWSAWLGAARGLVLIVLAWLPLRTGLLVALYLHRASRSDPSLPLHVMNQFLSPWIYLVLLAVPSLLAWRWIRMAPGEPGPREPQSAVPRGKSLAAVGLVFLAAMLLAMGLQINPVGTRKQGRVMFVERHSTWEPTTRPYDTEAFGGNDEDSVSYTYTLPYNYLGQFYEMSRLTEKQKIDDASLANCDVLVIKTPTARYSPQEVEAVVRFVQSGGGVLLIGDHTNIEKSSGTMNDISRHFGFIFRDDVLYSTESVPDQERYTAPRVPHPAIQHVPELEFAVSCSIEPGIGSGRPVIAATRLWSMPSEYHNGNFMPFAQHCPEMRYGAFVQVWEARYGKGRALAWADSTIFSSFCLYQPGKAEILLNMVEWLNHEGPGVAGCWLLMGLGLLALAAGAWLSWGCPAVWIVLVAASGCGWVAGSETVAAAHRWSMPLPEVQRPMPRIVIDRTTSQVPLAKGAFNENKQGQGYALMEQWIPRMGYTTARATGAEAFTGDALVVICPTLPASQEFRDRLVEYVADGGKLLVIDSGDKDPPSTANSLLRPFGLAIQYDQNWQGEITIVGRWPWAHVDHAWNILGGQCVASLGNERSFCATARYGKGLVMAITFGMLFNDASMGNDWSHYPNETELVRYQTFFALTRLLVEGKTIVPPTAPPKATGPKAPAPSSRQMPKGQQAPPRRPTGS